MRDNEDIYRPFRTYILEPLEGLTVSKVYLKLEEILLPKIKETLEFLATYRLQLPLSNYCTTKKIEEMGLSMLKRKNCT